MEHLWIDLYELGRIKILKIHYLKLRLWLYIWNIDQKFAWTADLHLKHDIWISILSVIRFDDDGCEHSSNVLMYRVWRDKMGIIESCLKDDDL